jgi:hypothetical protein
LQALLSVDSSTQIDASLISARALKAESSALQNEALCRKSSISPVLMQLMLCAPD